MSVTVPLRPMTVAGLMSGTSADGIDVALMRIEPRSSGEELKLELLAHQAFPFPAELAQAALAAQDAAVISVAALARLHWRLGLAYAEAYQATCAAHPALTVDLVGCHGQTIYHQGQPGEPFAGERFRCTWQIGEMALLADAAGVPVVSNFRPADMVAGGQGAPLVPILDLALYRHATRTRVLQNLGGIGNLTVVPPFGSAAAVLAFDTGPANMVIDALTRKLFGQPFDPCGEIAASGRPLAPLVADALNHAFFTQEPPKSAGREQFGEAFASDLLQCVQQQGGDPADAVATATAITAGSVALALRRFVLPVIRETEVDLIVSGGGANNRTLLHWIGEELAPDHVRVLTSDDVSLPMPLAVEAKEAAAFALLAYLSHHRRPANLPSATGARRAVILGQVTCA